MRTAWALLGPLARAERWRAPTALLLLAATAAFGVLLLGTSAWLIARAALRPSIAALHVAIAGVRFFGLARALSRYAERLVSHDLTLRVSGRLRGLVSSRLARLAPARLWAASGDVLARVVADVEELEGAFLKAGAPVAAAVLVVAAIGAYLASRGGAFAAVWVATVVVAGLLAPALVLRWSRVSGASLVAERGLLHARLADGIRGCAELVACGRGHDHAAGIAAAAAGLARHEARGARAAVAGGALASLAADLGVLGLLASGVAAVRAGSLDGVELAVMPLVALAGFEVVTPLAAAFRARGGIEAAAVRVAELLAAARAVRDPPVPLAAGPGARLEARGLRFTYPDGTRALDGLDLELRRGQLVALVGLSGAGKSTLVQLLLRAWEVEPGQLLLDGIDVRRMAAAAVRERLAAASVRDHVFAGTVRENLLLAAPDAGESRLWAALADAQLAETCAALPAGLDTWVGEHGASLSGGERQRLVLARALLRDAPIRVLDEPTAHLDAATAARLMRRLFAQRAGRATLVVSHRLAGLEDADEIVVLARGRVVERGRWSELIARQGGFARAVAEERGTQALQELNIMPRS